MLEQTLNRMGAPTRSASIPATSQAALEGGALLLNHPRESARGLKRAEVRRASRIRQRSEQAHQNLPPDPYMTGLNVIVSEPPKTSAATWASVVQPAWESRQA